ncbi:MAG: beta-lactamase family protein [Phenylobacterium sp.]|jgi:CubicO group peptidase (beta-lactamase class C family)|uniref:serine hydrolase domain-containing protein n=1 Tax=Phenylobacterium sp. TaxID=1871053 RepID=UPI0025E4557F|nr:serine hydrolase domain-containing protein [Phenylobacterium sp.]MCA3715860.1 beta-lactamase family protein [Phenylobacterium sp.]MCA3724745.1 beta-lactamase family protein [Phenylobacterium sp.]MCA3727636.1 beta-lactamase family protein [Phenylobacterium sp.]MCA6239122.1 beta-lactamase family protein [Phenylobacterium sp.]MCA6243327.1 beta-lactamase family protein [Phenylobacterium sp.]
MKRLIAAALAAGSLVAGSSAAQVALKPETPNLLFWSAEQQARWYPAMETVYQTRPIAAGDRVRALPLAGRTLDPVFTHAGRTWTVDEYMATYRVSGLLVIRDGRVLLEKYGLGRRPQDRWTSFSVAKSVTAILVGAAIQDGRIKSLQTPVTDILPELRGSAYDGVTLRQLLMMSSGVRWSEDYSDPNSDVAKGPTEGVKLAQGQPGLNPVVAYMRTLPRAHAPGTKFNYNTGETDLVGILLARAVGMGLADYASEKIWKPYGMEMEGAWVTDPGGLERGGCCISMTLRDYGRVGQFVLDEGVIDGHPVLPPGWAREATSKQIENGQAGYGYFWWMQPNGAYQATGIFGQSITTFREDRIIIVVNSAWPKSGGPDLRDGRTALINALRQAAIAPAP